MRIRQIIVPPLYFIKPQTSGQRHQKKINKRRLASNSHFIKSLFFKVQSCVGRSSLTGHITIHHRGKGHKRLYRPITFTNGFMLGIILLITYDPNRACFIQNIYDFIHKKFITSIAGSCTVGSFVTFFNRLDIFSENYISFNYSRGFRAFLERLPHNCLFFGLYLNYRLYQFRLQNATYARAAGTFCHLIQKCFKYCRIRLPSGLIKNVPNTALGTLGLISNTQHRFSMLGKAGRNRLLGKRPHVRGVAMNPIDHPHGGRTKPGRPSVTPWGRPALGYKTKK